jgi:glycosyltransferase involved in cell wall biosynthesis
VLDVPVQLPDYDVSALRHSLMGADAVTCISRFTQTEVSKFCALEPRIVYNPIKPVFPTGKKKYPHKFMFCGRVNDRMKRCFLGAAGIALAGYNGSDVVTVGSDVPSYGGNYWGVTSDMVLNEIYNSCEFLVFPSVFEGLGLPPIEMVFVGGIPIVCNDCPTMMEWFGTVERYSKLDPTPESIASFIKEMDDPNSRRDLQQQLKHLLDHSFRDKFERKRVAQRILDVYQGMA